MPVHIGLSRIMTDTSTSPVTGMAIMAGLNTITIAIVTMTAISGTIINKQAPPYGAAAARERRPRHYSHGSANASLAPHRHPAP